MVCKYKYNNNWYSKEELQSILYKEKGIDKYGKLVKPNTSKKILKSEKVYEVRWKNNGGVIIRTTDLNKAKAQMQGDYTDAKGNKLNTEDVVELVEGNPIEQIGIQPTQTEGTLKESIESVSSRINRNASAIDYIIVEPYYEINPITDEIEFIGYRIEDYSNTLPKELDKMYNTEQEAQKVIDDFKKKNPKKEYTEQALINTKIVALKEAAKKYPRSLIRSEVKKIEDTAPPYEDYEDDMFQKLPSASPSTDEIKYNDKGEVLAPNGEVSILYKDIELLVEEQNKEQGNLRENITDIANNSKWEHNRRLASFLLDSNFGINSFFKFVGDSMYEDLLKLGGWGLYYKDNNGVKQINIYSVLINKYFENDIERQKYYEEEVILHETIHLIVHEGLNANEDIENKLIDLMDFVKTKIDTSKYSNAFKNVQEFVAEAFTDAKFQIELKKIKYKGKLTVWNKFIELINIMAKSFGINTEYSVLEEIVSLTDILFNENKQLSLQLYRQTRSNEFKEWFGDSKVVDKNGEPLVVYHGTNNEFDIFNKGNIFFTDNKEYARGLAENNVHDKIIEGLDYDVIVMPAFLRLVNPKNVDYEIHHITLNEDKFEGYDGIIGKEAVYYDVNDYIAFEPNQIKSVFNQGTFSKENDNIAYYEKLPTTSPFEEFQKSLDKPDTNPVLTGNLKPDIILPIGTSGSGKSTWIKSVNTDNQFVVISPDDMRVEFTGDMNNKSKDDEIYQAVTDRAIQAVKEGKQVIVDTTNLKKERRRPFIDAVKKALPNSIIQYKLLPLNPELAKQRIKADIAAGVNRANVPDSTIDKHAKSYNDMLEDIKSEDISNYDYKEEQAKKFNELQEKLQDETFLEAVKSVFDNSSKLQQFAYETFLPDEDTSMKLSSKEEALSLYIDYVAKIALGIIRNPSSGEYNDNSKVSDVVYHGTDKKFESFSDESKATNPKTNRALFADKNTFERNKFGFWFTSDASFDDGKIRTPAYRYGVNIIAALIDVKNPLTTNSINKEISAVDLENRDSIISKETEIDDDDMFGGEVFEYTYPVMAVKNPNKIHILSSSIDIEGFEKYIFNKSKQKSIVETKDTVDNLPLNTNNIQSEDTEDIAEADNSPISVTPKKEVIQLPKTAQLILPIGISGSGKSTWINSLDKDKYTIISPDMIRKELTGDVSDNSRNLEIFKIVDDRILEALKKGDKVILDATNLNTTFRRLMITNLKSLYPKLDIRYKLLDVDPEIAKQRIANDISNKVDRSKTPDEIIDLQYQQYLQSKLDIKDEPIYEFNNERTAITDLLDRYSKNDNSLRKLTNIAAISGKTQNISNVPIVKDTDNINENIITMAKYGRTVRELLAIYPSLGEHFKGINLDTKLSDYIKQQEIEKQVIEYVEAIKQDMADNFSDYEDYLSKIDVYTIDDLYNYPNEKLLNDLCINGNLSK